MYKRRLHPSDRNAARSGPCLKQPTGLVEPAGCKIRFQQRELHQVDLGTASADTLTLMEHRLDRVDGRRVVAPLKG